MTAKEEVRALLDQLPEDASLEDIQYQLYVRQKVRRGLDAVAQGETLTQAQAEQKMARWLEK